MNRKESKSIGESGILKWVILAVFLLVAGCLFSCGASEVSMEIELSSTDADASGDASDDGKAESGQNVENEAFAEVQQKAESEMIAETQTKQKAEDEALTETGQKSEAEAITNSDCFVYVCGEVKSPGVYCMENGQRIFEAVEQAGGFTDQAVREYLNLADEICDGMKVFVPNREQVQSGQIPPEGLVSYGSADGSAVSAGTAGSSSTSAKINLNTASKEELMTLKGIGSARAEDIIRYREKHGGFQKIEDIKKVSGIKETAFEKIKDQITV